MVEKMKKVALLGFYGQGNFGDDAFLYIFLRCLEKKGYNVKVYGAAPLGDSMRNYCGFPLAFLFGKNRLVDKVLRVLCNFVSVLKNDMLIYGGGSVFGSYASYKQRWLTVNLAKFFNRSLFAVGVSFGPFRRDKERKDFQDLFNKFNGVVLRDNRSLSFVDTDLMGERVSLQEDVAFSLPDVFPEKFSGEVSSGGGIVVAIHLEEYADRVREILENIEGSVNVVSLERSSNDFNERFFRSLVSLFPEREIKFFPYFSESNFFDAANFLCADKCVITSKLHGAIVSASFCCPFFLFEYQEKCSDLLDFMKYRDFNEPLFLSAGERDCAKDFLVDFLKQKKGIENALREV
ncbi:polysaccharide pyruvyl transferase family protein [Pseudoalteromonas sp. GABNS16H]|uniref:polysaccharide pyruvyl transferase family protein n=1 Tax=Pseudoalteromonas sp. GABNS16H TaxID=3025325 RepID=UPI0023606F64|nr:polysaccharide pyruvyl transferase family protein [Pseudoalteromonas sp. GABNS16H]MDC9611684.1 polysaccharide pyruvyl transferase family protein [Pseudoalteromonas sp. GABNS16H]